MTPSPTPRFGAGTSAAVANGFPANSPYNSDLPYTIKQSGGVRRGHATTSASRLHVTAGGRYYDFSETRQFKSGGLFSNDDNRTDRTSSNGFTPRFILSYEPADNVRVNAQASQGFRLGGVNDPLNLPLMHGIGRAPCSAGSSPIMTRNCGITSLASAPGGTASTSPITWYMASLGFSLSEIVGK